MGCVLERCTRGLHFVQPHTCCRDLSAGPLPPLGVEISTTCPAILPKCVNRVSKTQDYLYYFLVFLPPASVECAGRWKVVRLYSPCWFSRGSALSGQSFSGCLIFSMCVTAIQHLSALLVFQDVWGCACISHDFLSIRKLIPQQPCSHQKGVWAPEWDI